MLESLLQSSMALLSFTGLYCTLLQLKIVLLDCTTFYHGSTLFYWILLHSTFSSTGYYNILPWHFLDFTTIYYGSTLFYWTLLHSTMSLFISTGLYIPFYCGSTWFYWTIQHSTISLLTSTRLYYNLPSLYLTLEWNCIALQCYSQAI